MEVVPGADSILLVEEADESWEEVGGGLEDLLEVGLDHRAEVVRSQRNIGQPAAGVDVYSLGRGKMDGGPVEVLGLLKKKAADPAALLFEGLKTIGAAQDDALTLIVKGNDDHGVMGLVDMEAREDCRGIGFKLNLPT